MIYKFLDSGNQKKLEQFGSYVISRPCSQAVWQPTLNKNIWQKADLVFTREGKSNWSFKKKVPNCWEIQINDHIFKVMLSDFGHLGIFPEHEQIYSFVEKKVKNKKNLNFLNLFAYTGAATIALAKTKAKVCHLDASKPMTRWAQENAKLNNLENAPIRYIADDVIRFLKREVRRNSKYDGIILDPPTFGRGPKGEVFKIEKDITILLDLCKSLLSKNALFLILSCHTPGFTPTTLSNLLKQNMKKGKITSGEILLKPKSGFNLPMGHFARWEND